MPTPHEGAISYTLKEMLVILEGKIDRLDAKLDRKADAADLDQIRTRVESAADRAAVNALDAKVTALEAQIELQDLVNEGIAKRTRELQLQSAVNFSRREKMLAAAISLAALFVAGYGVFL